MRTNQKTFIKEFSSENYLEISEGELPGGEEWRRSECPGGLSSHTAITLQSTLGCGPKKM